MVMAGRDYQDGCQRVALFFGTQIGATEEFAKTLVEEAKARYDKVVFTVVDLDDYGAEDEDRGVPGKAQEVEHGAALPGNVWMAMYGSAISSPPSTDYVQYYTCSAKEAMHIYSS
ncbi:NADPH--cytochrome P450 reductase 1-like isoform X2 [Lolium perenne]|uniref:NADPH--cytochrome P450 reductase 1-like n=1 Tax=Lolium perenne TaxID=4522 RepID=UPI0021F67187|nr:NADPH--cytochrome P450 reductase 1-like isoform X2 [Lolium perenne]